MPKKETGILPILLILLQSLLYGFGDPITKKAYRVMPVFSLLAVRYMIAFVVLILLFGKRVRQNLRAVPVKDWLLPSVCIGLTYILNNLALKLTARLLSRSCGPSRRSSRLSWHSSCFGTVLTGGIS